jgi:DNA-binding CsgD family transcriptional regulator
MKSILLLLPFLSLFTYAQNRIATPQITHYRSQDYRAGMQNWDVEQDASGILYFGNNEGLLTFNGRYWSVHPLPNRTVVRSVEIDADGRIFVGAQDELGYFFPDRQGILRYHSLLPLLPAADRSFNDIWNIVIRGKDVFFQSLRQIMWYRDGKMTVYKSASAWAYMGMAGQQLYGQERGKGLFRLSGTTWQPVCQDSLLARFGVTGILESGAGDLILTTLKKGIFRLRGSILIPLRTAVDETLLADRIYCALRLGPGRLAVGTSSAGVFLLNEDGAVLDRYSSADGLQSANIRGMWLDREQNLWLGLDDGIDHVAINSPIQYLSPGGNAAGYSLAIHEGNLYAGMSSGLFVAPLTTGDLSKGRFRELAAGKGQVWNLDVVNNQLLMGHENGLYRIEGNWLTPVYLQTGTWLVRRYAADAWLAGTYQGLRGLGYRDGRFQDRGQIAGMKEPLRFLVTDSASGTVWSSHPVRGVFRFRWDRSTGRYTSMELLTDKQGLPSARYNYVYKIRGKMMVATEKGVYEYRSGRFFPEPTLTKVLGTRPLQYLKDDRLGNVWFASDKQLGYVDFRRKGDPVVYFPEMKGRLVGGFEFIHPVDEENIFIGSDKGFFRLNYRKYQQETRKPGVLLGEIRVTSVTDSLVFGGYRTKEGKMSDMQGDRLVLAAGMNSLHIEFSSPPSALQNTVEFSYQLEGFDRGWSAWSPKPEKDYTRLPWGSYVFLVKARNNFGNESPVLRCEIEILPAWYEGYVAWLVYAILTGGLLFQLFTWQRRKHVRKQQQLQYLHQLEMDRSEKEIVRLKNEKLEAEMDFKNRELATMTMQLVQRGEILVKVKEVITSWVKKQDAKDSALSFRQVLRLIRDVESKDADWGQFTLHFNTVNEDFFVRLKDQYPELTPNDLKLCAFLKMNLSSKEIARLMNVTVKAIEVGRYRLRKKLQLPAEANLYEFLTGVGRG